MKIANIDYAQNVVRIGSLARQLQARSAKPQNHDEAYRIATDIMLECQQIREQTQKRTSVLKDYINRITG